jgi:glycosyltransferase involved in cell wall biosynthesis
MQTLPLVTIVISTFNGERWLSETLQSVLSQTYPKDRIEIIVIDDGSTDASEKLAANLLKLTAIRHLVKRTKNQGINSANNLGWNIANGEWVLFLGHDDLLHTEKISRSFEVKNSYSEEIAGIHANWQKYRAVDSERWAPWGPIKETKLPPHPRFPLMLGLLEGTYIHGSAMFFRKTWLEKVKGFDTCINSAEDNNIQIKIEMAGGKFHHISSSVPLSFWRDSPNSWSKRGLFELGQGIVHNMNLVEETLRSHQVWNEKIKEQLAFSYFSSGRLLARKPWKDFRRVKFHLKTLKPGYRPAPSQMGARDYWIYRIFGYTYFALLGLIYRKLKTICWALRGNN